MQKLVYRNRLRRVCFSYIARNASIGWLIQFLVFSYFFVSFLHFHMSYENESIHLFIRFLLSSYFFFLSFVSCVLPRIHSNVKCLILDSISMEAILLAGKYPVLREIKLFNFNQEIFSRYFTGKKLMCSDLFKD